MDSELKEKVIRYIKKENEPNKYYYVSLKKVIKPKLSLKFRLNLIIFLTIVVLIACYSLSLQSEGMAAMTGTFYFLALGIFIIKKIKDKVLGVKYRPNEAILRRLIVENDLYEMYGDRVVNQIKLGYVDKDDIFEVIITKDGGIYQEVSEKLGRKLESALNYELIGIENKPTFIAYDFRKKPLQREYINQLDLNPKESNLMIDIYGDTKISLRKNFSTLISGASGAGKSYLVYAMLAKYLQNFVVRDGKRHFSELYLIDPKASDLLKHMQFSGMPQEIYGTTVADAFRILKDVTEEMERRKAIYEKTDKFDVCMVDLGYPPILLIIDEYSSLVNMMDKKQRPDFDRLVGNLLRLSRQLSIGVWIISQSPDAKTFGDSGTRSQLVNSFYMGMPDQQASLMMFNKSQKDLPVVTDVGEGLSSIDGSEPKKFYSPTFTKNVDEVIQPLLKQSANYFKEKSSIDWNDLV